MALFGPINNYVAPGFTNFGWGVQYFEKTDNTQGRISGGLTPPPPRNFHIFLKSEEKEVERGKRDGGRSNC